MYESFFGLRERPFDMVPDPRFLFLGARQREALSSLQYGLTTPRGLTLLLGDAGTGKTTLVHAALANLESATVRVVLLSNPTLTRAEFYEYLAQAFGLTAEAGPSKTRFLVELRRQLEEGHAGGVLSALVVDEAQSVPHELLEEIRLLGNIETPTRKLLNVILAGQPELAERLNHPSLRQLKQRISLRCELTSMNLSETAAYIAGRVRIAGGRPECVFTREAVEAIHTASKGLPRTVNVLCDNALLNGFALDASPVTKSIVHEVCRDLDLHPTPSPPAAFDGARPEAPDTPHRTPADRSRAGLAGAVPVAAADGQEQGGELFSRFARKRRFSIF